MPMRYFIVGDAINDLSKSFGHVKAKNVKPQTLLKQLYKQEMFTIFPTLGEASEYAHGLREQNHAYSHDLKTLNRSQVHPIYTFEAAAHLDLGSKKTLEFEYDERFKDEAHQSKTRLKKTTLNYYSVPPCQIPELDILCVEFPNSPMSRMDLGKNATILGIQLSDFKASILTLANKPGYENVVTELQKFHDTLKDEIFEKKDITPHQGYYQFILERSIQLTNEIGKNSKENMLNVVKHYGDELDKKLETLHANKPMSTKLKACIHGVIGALVGMFTGAAIGISVGAACGFGFGSLPGAVLGLTIGAGIGTKHGIFKQCQKNAAYQAEESSIIATKKMLNTLK